MKPAVIFSALFGTSLVLLLVAGTSINRHLLGNSPRLSFEEYNRSAIRKRWLPDDIRHLRDKVFANDGNVDLDDALDYARKVTIYINKLFRYESQHKPPYELFKDVIDAWTKVLEVDSDNEEALRLMAELSLTFGDANGCAYYFSRYAQVVSSDDSILTKKAQCFILNKKTEQAKKIFEELISRQRDLFQSYLGLAAISMLENESTDNIKKLLKAAKSNAKNEREKLVVDEFMLRAGIEGADNRIDKVNLLKARLKSYPVSGSKFQDAKVLPNRSIIRLYYRNFPIKAMPQHAKEIFIKRIANDMGDIFDKKSILFLEIFDSVSEEMLERFNLENVTK